MDNVCLYLRKSREDEELEKAFGEGSTLIKHKNALLKFAEENNLNIVKTHEEVVSGEKLIFRPAMLELLKEVEQGAYNGVLVMDIQRLGRGDMKDQGVILETFKNSGTKIITPVKTYDLNNEFDEEYSEFEAFMSRKEYKMINRRMQGGRIRSIQEGNYISTYPPYGYEIHLTRQYRTLKPHPEQADVVRLIFDMYTSRNMGCTKIAAELNKMGVKSYTFKTWERTAISNMIKNPVYIGKVVWKRKCIRKSAVPGKSKETHTREKSEWILAVGKHPALIDEETFHKAQEIISSRHHTPNRPGSALKNPFAGLIVCGGCGSKMKKRPYRNGSPHLLCEKCGNKSSRFQIVMERLLSELEHLAATYEIQIITENISDDDSFQLRLYKRSLSALEKELDGLKKQKLSIYDLFEQKVYNNSTFLERRQIIAERIKHSSDAIESLKLKIEEETHLQLKALKIPDLKSVLELYKVTGDIGDKNMLLKKVFERVEYFKDKSQKGDCFVLNIFPKLLP